MEKIDLDELNEEDLEKVVEKLNVDFPKSLSDKIDMSFESKKETDVLERYLEEVLGEDISTGNFTTAQEKALLQLVWLNERFLEGEIDDDKNSCKIMITVIVLLSKGRSGYALELMRDFLSYLYSQEEDLLPEDSKEEGSE